MNRLRSTLLTAAALFASRASALDHSVRPGLGRWWLPYNYSVHGGAIDGLFTIIFWLTMIVLIGVQATLVHFVIKYRQRPGKVKAKHIHGNMRLEMIWTLIPAVILAVLALGSKGIWDRFRYAEDYDTTPPTEVMVIGEQFLWNFVYPGKDGKFGQYLAYPRPSDPKYRKLPYEQAMSKINKDILENPLGQNQNFDADPEAKFGQDDDYDHNPGRPLILPVGKPIAVTLSSKDVIHDFFLPNFRVKLDALPGMAGRLNFTAVPGALSTEELKIDDPNLVGKPIWIGSETPGSIQQPNDDVSQVYYYLNGKDANGGKVQVKGRQLLDAEAVAALKRAGVQKVVAITRPFELVCEELCGQGHYNMRGEVYFVSAEQYKNFIEKPPKSEGDTAEKKPNVTSTTTPPQPVSAAK